MAAAAVLAVVALVLAVVPVWRRRARPDPLIQERFARYCMR